jgi:NAD(P)H-dependent FMN reductase
MTVISVIVGSTREGRFSEKPAKWIFAHLKKRERVDARLRTAAESSLAA